MFLLGATGPPGLCRYPENWYAEGASKPGALGPKSAGRAPASDRLRCCWFARTALWFASVGDDCALLVEAAAAFVDAFANLVEGFLVFVEACVILGEVVAGGSGVLMSSILRTAGGGESMSSMLRIGGLLIPPPFVPGRDECLGTGGSTSSMLLTGDRGVANGEPVRAGAPVELAEPLCLPPAAVLSRRAKTSLRSSSNTASIDIGLCAMIAVYVYRLRRRNPPSWMCPTLYQAATMPRQWFLRIRVRQERLKALRERTLSIYELSGFPEEVEILHRG